MPAYRQKRDDSL